MVTVSDKASAKIVELLQGGGNPDRGLRMAVMGGV